MTTKEKIDRLKKIQKQKYDEIHTTEDARDFAALESAIEALEMQDKCKDYIAVHDCPFMLGNCKAKMVEPQESEE